MEIGLREILIVIGIAIIGIILLDGFRRVRRSHSNSLKVSWNLGDDLDDDEVLNPELPGQARKIVRSEPDFQDPRVSGEQSDPIFAKRTPGAAAETTGRKATFEAEQQDLFTEPQVTAPEKGPRASLDSRINTQPIEEIIIINVLAKEEAFRGDMLLEALLSCGMRFGRMDIFHRHEKSNGDGAELFSMANITEPGYFDINKMDEFETRGVCLFMSLPGPENVQLALDLLIDSGRKISNALGGEMRDENHSVLTQQTIEHYRQRVSDFERKSLSGRVIS